jgi:hypothetical protein
VVDTLQTQNGKAAGRSSPNVGRRCPRSARRRGGRYGLLSALALELGNSQTTLPTAVGHDNASARAGGRRRRSSQRPGCNGPDTVKVRQVWCTEPTSHTQTWGKFTMGSLVSYKRPQGFGRVTVKKSGPKPSRWKAGCGESRTSGLERGKGCKALPIATGAKHRPAGFSQAGRRK